MHIDSDAERVSAFCHLLSGVWGIFVLPLAVEMSHAKRFRLIGVLLWAAVCAFACIFIHDLNAHLTNRRPWVPFYEFWFGLAVPVERSSVFAECPFSISNATMKVTHVRRGKHALSIWIPDKLKDFTPVNANIRIDAKFSNREGKRVFSFHSDDTFARLWTWCRGKRGGSREMYFIYSTPKDVPLDEELTVEITVAGEGCLFSQSYPGARFSIEKYSDK